LEPVNPEEPGHCRDSARVPGFDLQPEGDGVKKTIRAMLVALALAAPVAVLAPPAQAGPPAGTCGASEGCGCGGVYVLKYKKVLVHC
jgi:hypothetical protein